MHLYLVRSTSGAQNVGNKCSGRFASFIFFDIKILLLIDLFYSCQQTLRPNRVQNGFLLQSETPHTMSFPLNPWLFPCWLVDEGEKPERLKASCCHPSWFSRSLPILTPPQDLAIVSQRSAPLQTEVRHMAGLFQRWRTVAERSRIEIRHLGGGHSAISGTDLRNQKPRSET